MRPRRGGAAPAAGAGRAGQPGHAGPRLRGALPAAAGAGGCAGESPAAGAGSPEAPLAQPPSHRGVAAVFQQAPACAVGPAAASPGSPSVRRPPGPAEWPGWVEKGGKCARGVRILALQQSVNPLRLLYQALQMSVTLGILCKVLPCFFPTVRASASESTFTNIYIVSL